MEPPHKKHHRHYVDERHHSDFSDDEKVANREIKSEMPIYREKESQEAREDIMFASKETADMKLA
jgi:hypothetical protein